MDKSITHCQEECRVEILDIFKRFLKCELDDLVKIKRSATLDVETLEWVYVEERKWRKARSEIGALLSAINDKHYEIMEGIRMDISERGHGL